MPQVRLSYDLDTTAESKWLTVVASPAARTGLAFVQELGDFRCGPGYFTNREHLPSYLIKLCVGGNGFLEYDGERYPIRPGEVFWIDCMNAQWYYTDPDCGHWELLWVHLNGASCRAYYELFRQQNNGSPVVNVGQDAALRSVFDMLLKLYEKGSNTIADDVAASSLLTQLMVRCIQASDVSMAQSRLPGYVTDARSYIRTHYAEPISLDELSRIVSVNKFYLQKQFKRYTGISPNEYLTHTRLTHAKSLLRSTPRPIGQIAADVGISNVGHFINLFSRYEGVTPSGYRKQWFNAEEPEENGSRAGGSARSDSEMHDGGSNGIM